jgi:DNA-binding SARP family transcriptional activator
MEEEQRIAEEARRKEEEDQRRQQAEIAALRAKEEEETRKYEEAVRQAIEEGRRLAQSKKVRTYLDLAKEMVTQAQFDDALNEITKIFRIDPTNADARAFEQTIYSAREEHLRRGAEAERLQEEQRRKVEEIQRKLEEQNRREEEERQRRAIRETKIAACLQKTRDFLKEGKFERALNEIETIYAMDPGNTEAQELEVQILNAERKSADIRAITRVRTQQGEEWKKEEEEKERAALEDRERLHQESANTYRSVTKQAWVDGIPTPEEQSMLEVVRLSLGIPDTEQELLEREVQLEAYAEALQSAWKNGLVAPDDESTNEKLRQLFGVSLEDHRAIQTSLLSRSGS